MFVVDDRRSQWDCPIRPIDDYTLVQVYAKNAIFFRSQPPVLTEAFQRGKHLEYSHPGNPIDNLIHSIPGVPARDTSLDHVFYPDGR